MLNTIGKKAILVVVIMAVVVGAVLFGINAPQSPVSAQIPQTHNVICFEITYTPEK